MTELESLNDIELQDYIDDLNYILDYGCTVYKAGQALYQLGCCIEIQRRRSMSVTPTECPGWFDNLLNGNHETF